MNVFGAFTFGSLMKSLLPGALVFTALWFSERSIDVLAGMGFSVSSVLVLPFAFIFSVLIGLTINTFVFMGLIDRLVRDPYLRDKTKSEQLEQLKRKVDLSIVAHYIAAFDAIEEAQTYKVQDFADHIDVRYLLQVRAGETSFAGLKEAYWSWLEFQINFAVALCLSVAALWPAFLLPSSRLAQVLGAERITWFVVLVVGVFVFIAFLIKAARTNYNKDRQKQLSMIIGAFVDAQQASRCRELEINPVNRSTSQ